MFKKLLLLVLLSFINQISFGQNVELFTQWNGRYDFTFVGNTMNIAENNPSNFLVTNTSSSANLNLNPDDTIVAAYLYWAGSGDGDFDVLLNGIATTPDRTFGLTQLSAGLTLTYFSAFKDITSYVQSTGNGTYTLSELDISPFELLHYQRKTNFAGWAILLVYENPNLPLNQLNIYDGLQGVPTALTITLDNLNILDNSGATAGFIAWEGDLGLATENFYINNQVLSNALNPFNNVFNGTNSILGIGSGNYYNMDLDIYDIENYISIGQTDIEIELTSSQDFIMINTVVTKVNSQLPDATIIIDDYTTSCNEGAITVDFTVQNVNSTEILPANTPIGFYIGSELIGSSLTLNDIPIGGSESGSILLSLPPNTPEVFTLTAFVDDLTIITELVETNNTFEIEVTQWLSPSFNSLNNLISCNLGLTSGLFDFSNYEFFVTDNPDLDVAFFESFEDAELNTNELFNTSNYLATSTPKDIFIRIENEFGCYSITSFQLLTENCPPTIYNAVSANEDGMNDEFFIDGLRDIFVNFKLEVYNRWGKLLWVGDNSKPFWKGYVEEGIGHKEAPEGTYFYILYLNDSDYPEALTGYLYITR